MVSTAELRDRPQQADEKVQRCYWDDPTGPVPPTGPAGFLRAWDLHPGDHFHGRTIAAIHGVVGLASSPVAVISFSGHDVEHPRQTRIGATHTDTDRGHDELRFRARAWVQEHRLAEGQVLNLGQLRTDVLAAIA